jgi:gliding motility-associated-like protein
LANGSIISQINGGTSPFMYSWNAGTYSSPNVINIPANSYSLNVTDGNNCLATYSVVVNNLAGPSIVIVSTTSVLCYGGNSASAAATISNALSPYNFNWLPTGGNLLMASNLAAGSYTAQLIDAKGCVVTANAIISQPLLLSVASVSVTDVLCFGQNNGSIDVSIIGGSSVYSYTWTPNISSSSVASNLTATSYTVLVADNNNCNASVSILVNQPTPLTSSISNIINPICYNTSGSSTVSAVGGTMPYVYNWSTSPTQTCINASNIYPGNYTVSIVDINGCSVSNSLSIIEPSQIITSLGINDSICIGQQASIIANAIGGSGNYYYAWNPLGIINSGTVSVSPATNTSYTVVAFDQNGCAGIEDSVNIVVYDLTSANVQVTGQSPICFGQVSMVEGQVNGNTGPVNISWNNGLGNTTGPFIEQPFNPMTYVMTVSNACGLSISDSVSVTFNPAPTIHIISDAINGCAPSVINFSDSSITGNTFDPITSWSWNFGDGVISSSQNPLHVFNSAGIYTVNLTVTTDAGCTTNSSSSPIIIHTYSAPIANFSTNMIDFDIPYDALHCTNLSNGATTYEWSFGDDAFSVDVNPSYLYNSIGQYQIQLVVSNQHGCKDTAVSEIETHADVVFPNAFTPNPDGSSGGSYSISSLDNNVFFPYTSGVIDFKLQIYDRWGELIFESTDVKTGWDGYYRGKLCQMGVYIWKAYVKLNDNRIFRKTGDLTLLR